ncbi:MAG: hypothetical protein GWN73_27160, partial [Actinobacteria bacterium]|nr:hypothetical protein [Actinomycetota bacterium]NIU68891.1 hypothetical protein [Actinomycetota bacterium]NIW30740.1 hypothetical protein [Actinomycetota bacterium]
MDADSETSLNLIAGAPSAAVGVTGGGSVSIGLLEKETEAFVDQGAVVTALAEAPGILASNGRFVDDPVPDDLLGPPIPLAEENVLRTAMGELAAAVEVVDQALGTAYDV